MIIATLIVINILLWYTNRKEPVLEEVKERYRTLREHLKKTDEPKFRVLHDEIPIVAYKGSLMRGVGYNTNKGQEIGLCIDGEVNHVFHVLLHELAHCTVDEYSHSDNFWDNYEELRNEAITIGVYDNIGTLTPFCGKQIVDK